MFERPDRAVANQQWINLHKDAGVENLVAVGSNHAQFFLLLIHGIERVSFFPLELRLSGYYRKFYAVSSTDLEGGILIVLVGMNWPRTLKFLRRK